MGHGTSVAATVAPKFQHVPSLGTPPSVPAGHSGRQRCTECNAAVQTGRVAIRVDVTIDCAEPELPARFWRAMLGHTDRSRWSVV